MRLSQRLIAAAVLIALSGALAGCGGGGFGNWDPTDLLDWLDTKKKLPGERKPVFPDGVPGLEQGVPKELNKGAAQQQVDVPAQTVAVAPPAEPRKSKRAAKSRQPAAAQQPAAAAEPDPAAEEGGTAAAPPAPKPKKIVRKRTTAPPPDPAAQAAQPAQTAQQPTQAPQQSAPPFPAPMPGTFTR